MVLQHMKVSSSVEDQGEVERREVRRTRLSRSFSLVSAVGNMLRASWSCLSTVVTASATLSI